MEIRTATAAFLTSSLDTEGFPEAAAWNAAPPIRFDADWKGENPNPLRQTDVRLLWSLDSLYVRFRARYRTMTVFSDAEPSGRRNFLWDRDVAEVFLQPDPSRPGSYKEFEVSPNGMWIDLDIAPDEKRDLRSGLRRRMHVDTASKEWTAELVIPMRSIVAGFDPAEIWRANFYRVEGPAEPRFYSAWSPTGTPQPNFHVPEAFGRLVFAKDVKTHSPKN